MSISPQQFDHKTWWFLKKINRELLKNPHRIRATVYLHLMSKEPAIPTVTEQENTMKRLQDNGIIRFAHIPQSGNVFVVGMYEYSVEVLQPYFNNLYKEFELEFSVIHKIKIPARIDNLSDDIKKKISNIITVVLQKCELETTINSTI